MALTPLGSAGLGQPSIGPAADPHPAGPVWLLEDAARPARPLLAIAERLGCEVRRVPLRFTWRRLLPSLQPASLAGLASSLPLLGGAPALTLSQGSGPARIAAWLKAGCGSRMVHYGAGGRAAAHADLRIGDRLAADTAQSLALLAPPQRLAPLDRMAADAGWRERLDHLPHPRLLLALGPGPFGSELHADEVASLATGLARAVKDATGAIVVVALPGTGADALAAIETAIAGTMHIVHRPHEPGPAPFPGLFAAMDAMVVAGRIGDHLAQACAYALPCYLGLRLPPGALARRLLAQDQIRPLQGTIAPWPRQKLDEADRAAAAIRRLLDAPS